MFWRSPELQTIKKEWLELFDKNTLHGAFLYAVLIAAVAWVIGRAVAAAFRRLEKPNHLAADRTAIKFLGQLGRLVVYLFAFIFYAHLIPTLNGLGHAWLASVGVVSVVLGLAAQNTLGNLIAGISLLLYRPFNLGDRLQINAPSGVETGVVEGLNLGYTVLRTLDNRRLVIPNSLMASQTSINLSDTDARKLCQTSVRLTRDTDIERARAILAEIAQANPKVLKYVGCPVTALGPTSVTLSVQVLCRDNDVASDIRYAILESAKSRFEKSDVKMYWRPDLTVTPLAPPKASAE